MWALFLYWLRRGLPQDRLALIVCVVYATLGEIFLSLLLLCLWFGTARRLYAVMFVLALAMEVYGTWLGNRAWSPSVPWFGLTTINPPLAAGAFYCVLDLLVVATVARLRAGPARGAAHALSV